MVLSQVLRDWTEDEGTPLARRALVARTYMGHLVAYVGVPSDHPLAGLHYDRLPLECHGGLTFSQEGGTGIWPAGWYWYGWDYAHAGDHIPGMLFPYGIWPNTRKDRVWTLQGVVEEARIVLDRLRNMMQETI